MFGFLFGCSGSSGLRCPFFAGAVLWIVSDDAFSGVNVPYAEVVLRHPVHDCESDRPRGVDCALDNLGGVTMAQPKRQRRRIGWVVRSHDASDPTADHRKSVLVMEVAAQRFAERFADAVVAVGPYVFVVEQGERPSTSSSLPS